MSGVFDVAVRATLGGLSAASYKDGVLVDSREHSARTGTLTWVGALATGGFTVASVEWRSGGLSGTLLDQDVFSGSIDPTTLGWAASSFGGWNAVTAAGVRFAGGAVSEGMQKTTPVGADTAIMRGVFFTAEGGPHWGMLSLHYDATGDASGNPGGPGYYGIAGYRVLIRELHPHSVELPDASAVEVEPPAETTLGGWTVAGLRA